MIKQNILTFSLLFLMISCSSYTEVTYDDTLTDGFAVSKPIELSIRDVSRDRFYFILENQIGSSEYFIKLRWIVKGNKRFSNGMNTNLKLLINNFDIIQLKPYSHPRIVSYMLDPKGIEEEIKYKISREELLILSESKNVLVSLEGKYHNRAARFNWWKTKKAIADFLKNT